MSIFVNTMKKYIAALFDCMLSIAAFGLKEQSNIVEQRSFAL